MNNRIQLTCLKCGVPYTIGKYWNEKRFQAGKPAFCTFCSRSFSKKEMWKSRKGEMKNPKLVPENAKYWYWLRLNDNRRTRVYVFICENSNCKNEIKVRAGKFVEPSGYCRSCAAKHSAETNNGRKIQPYMYLFNIMKTNAKLRNIPIEMSYEEFLDFTQETNCTYCGTELIWEPHFRHKGTSQAYNLDRIDHSLGYTKENCIPCCLSCNFTRGNRFTHEEFLMLTEGLHSIMNTRKGNTE